MEIRPDKTDFNLSSKQTEKIKQFNLEMLIPFLDDFSKVIGAPIDLLLYPSNSIIYSTGCRSVFEKLIKMSPDICLTCQNEPIQTEDSINAGDGVKVTCEHGLVYLITPIEIFKDTVAYIYRSHDLFKTATERTSENSQRQLLRRKNIYQNLEGNPRDGQRSPDQTYAASLLL